MKSDTDTPNKQPAGESERVSNSQEGCNLCLSDIFEEADASEINTYQYVSTFGFYDLIIASILLIAVFYFVHLLNLVQAMTFQNNMLRIYRYTNSGLPHLFGVSVDVNKAGGESP